jgi:pantetheine-phosphate adenylyltransferase
MARIAYYPGTFDPVTNGHVDVLRAALALADKVVVAVGVNPGKSPLFSLKERQRMVAGMIRGLGRGAAGRVTATTFEGLVVEAAAKAGATILVRGLRDATDFDYEMQMAGMNGALAPGLRTVFVPASPATRHITATLVRQVAALGGDVSSFVPKSVARMVARRISAR